MNGTHERTFFLLFLDKFKYKNKNKSEQSIFALVLWQKKNICSRLCRRTDLDLYDLNSYVNSRIGQYSTKANSSFAVLSSASAWLWM